MRFELPSSNQTYRTGQCIPLKIVDLPKEPNAMISVNIYPVLPFPIGFFSVDNQGNVDVPCLIVFPYNYSYLRNFPSEGEMSIDVNGQGSLFLQVAGTTSFKFKQELPRKVYVKAHSDKGKYVISVYGYNREYQFVRKSYHTVNPNEDVYIPILLGDMIEVDGWYTLVATYTDSPDKPVFNNLESKVSFYDLVLEFSDKPEDDSKPYYEVIFINPNDCNMNLLYVDYYTGWSIAEISPHSKYYAFVNKKYPWYAWQCGMKSGSGVVTESGEVRL